MNIGKSIFYIAFVMIISSISANAEEKPSQQQQAQPQQQKQDEKPQQDVKLDMVSDTVASVFNKANALLAGNLEITMSNKVEKRDDYTINAMGQRVPKSTAIKAGGSLHNDQPL